MERSLRFIDGALGSHQQVFKQRSDKARSAFYKNSSGPASRTDRKGTRANGKSYGGLWRGGYRHGDITYSRDVSGSATEFGSRLNVGLEGRDEKENPTFLTSTAEEKAVTFETPGEKVIWGKRFN